MINRLFNDSEKTTTPPPEDRTARVVARILEARPKVTVGNVSEHGMVRFTLSYRPLGISPHDVGMTALLRRSMLAEFLGQYLILINLNDFLHLLTECNYAHFVRKYPAGRYVGLHYDSHVFTFQFNIALLHRLLNEELTKALAGEKATVKWNWDFFRRDPKNPAH